MVFLLMLLPIRHPQDIFDQFDKESPLFLGQLWRTEVSICILVGGLEDVLFSISYIG